MADVNKDVLMDAKHHVRVCAKVAVLVAVLVVALVVALLLAKALVKEVAPVDALDALAHVPVAVVLLALDHVTPVVFGIAKKRVLGHVVRAAI